MQIHTLVEDIYKLVTTKDDWFTNELAADFGANVARRLQLHFGEKERSKLRLSKMGPMCPRALWYSIHHPELAEPLPAPARVKYSYGHILEALAICLIKAAGHEVTGEQDELILDGVTGHRDCVVDGCTLDVKSTSSFGFSKFKDKTLIQDDSFGYLDQLDGYVVAGHDDPLVRDKSRGYILAIDKTLGKMVLYEHQVREDRIRKRISEHKRLVGLHEPPDCMCGKVPHGQSGNIKLDTKASYSSFKYVCFPHLRTFIYADGPVYLTQVVRKPDVLEVDKHGKPVYRM